MQVSHTRTRTRTKKTHGTRQNLEWVLLTQALVGETYRRVSMSTHSISYPSHKFILIYCASFLYGHNCDRQNDSHTGNIHFFGPTVPLLKSRVITSNGDTSDMQEKPRCIRTTHADYPFIYQLPCTTLYFFSHISDLAPTCFGVLKPSYGASIQLQFLHNTQNF
jgi:hypothetical protein